MKRILSKSYYKLLPILVALLAASSVKAEYITASSNHLSHHLGLSGSFAEANRITAKQTSVINAVGWDAALSASYEMSYRTWFWGFGLEASWQQINDRLDHFIDMQQRVDIDGEQLSYQYVYTDYRERAKTFDISIPIYLGKSFNRVYTMVGFRFDIPVKARYDVTNSMYTQGVYPWSITPVVTTPNNDFSSLGFYSEQQYQYTKNYEKGLHITPFMEVGYEVFHADRVQMRAGAYAALAIPLLNVNRVALSDYSSIDTNPSTQNVENLQKNIGWNPLAHSDKYLTTPTQLEVGIKLSFLFNVTTQSGKCMCTP